MLGMEDLAKVARAFAAMGAAVDASRLPVVQSQLEWTEALVVGCVDLGVQERAQGVWHWVSEDDPAFVWLCLFWRSSFSSGVRFT